MYPHKNCLHTINPEKTCLDNELSVDTIKFYDNVTASSFKMDLTKLSMANKTVKLLDQEKLSSRHVRQSTLVLQET